MIVYTYSGEYSRPYPGLLATLQSVLETQSDDKWGIAILASWQHSKVCLRLSQITNWGIASTAILQRSNK